MLYSLLFVVMSYVSLVRGYPAVQRAFDDELDGNWINGYGTAELERLGSPLDLTVTSLENDIMSAGVAVSWKPPKGFDKLMGSKAILDYLLYYCEEGATKWEVIHVPGSMTSLFINGLHRNKLYHFRIRASTGDANGPQSDAVFHNTGEESSGEESGEGSADDHGSDDTLDNESEPSIEPYEYDYYIAGY